MKSTRRLLEFAFLLMAITSGLLLSTSLGSVHYLLVGSLGTLVGFILVDWTRWFVMPPFVANLLSFVVLYMSMRGFFSTETSGQLGSVADLLVYLQTLLVLQSKTARQYWQLMVLSFLQIVVASVFHMQLEGGVLFIVYMAVSALFLVLLNSMGAQQDAALQAAADARENRLRASSGNRAAVSVAMPDIILEFPADRFSVISRMFRHSSAWILSCLAFAAVLFILIPRTDTPWFAGRNSRWTTVGANQKVSLDERGRVQLSYIPVLTATFRRGMTAEPTQLQESVYFRSMALGSLVVENGNSTWKAPYDRIYSSSWMVSDPRPFNGPGVWVEIVQEATTDPTLQTIEPFSENYDRPLNGRYSPELSVLRRHTADTEVEFLPFEYEFRARLNNKGEFLDAYPYKHLMWANPELSMADNMAEYKWLTALDRSRYPGTIRIAEQEAATVSNGDHLKIARHLEDWFLSAGRFTYTLDYSRIVRQESLDSIEDFTVNHRQGHCEMFASSLAVMLRSVGIPARFVVGFYGGNYVAARKHYQVTGGHAHAWVEAYIAPEYCTDEMQKNGEASGGGVWLRLDPTPPSVLRDEAANGSNAINLARNLWQEYVMRLESDKQLTWGERASSVIVGALDLTSWSAGFEAVAASVQARPALYAATVGPGFVVLAIAILIVWFKKFHKKKPKAYGKKKVSAIRRLIGNTLGVIVPALGDWIRGRPADSVWFFDRMTAMLEKYDLTRSPQETYVEFASSASRHFERWPAHTRIRQSIDELVDRFQKIRFGGEQLFENERSDFEQRLKELAKLLAEGPEISAPSRFAPT